MTASEAGVPTDMKIIGAGLPRTGTNSLKLALEQLTGGRCHHMFEVMQEVERTGPLWFSALHGELDKLAPALEGFTTCVDWPAALFWRELAEANPDAPVLLSHRGDAATWWASADATVWASMRRNVEGTMEQIFSQSLRIKAGLDDRWLDDAAMLAHYDEHEATVRAEIDPDRLIYWQPGDGWGPLAEALNVPVPDEPFPRTNARAEFRARAGLDKPES